MNRRDPLFELAEQRADIVAVASGLKLFRAGRTLRGECPINGCSAGKKADGAFWVDERRQRFGCFNCECQREIGGDAVALEHALHSHGVETLRHAAARLAGVDLDRWDAEQRAKHDDYRPAQGIHGQGLGKAQPTAEEAEARREARALKRAAQEREDADRDEWILDLAGRLWREAVPAAGTPVEHYLRDRGITGRPLDMALAQVRFHPAAFHSGKSDQWGGMGALTLPAMVSLIVAPLGLEIRPTGAVHVTYLAEGGDLVWRRAAVDRSKTIWGPPKLSPRARDPRDDRPDRWGGVWLTPPTSEGPLLVGEGIESVLSAAVLAGEPVRAVAALSLGALQGGWAVDRYGRVDVDLPKADPEAPAFTWPEPEGAGFGEVRICVDRDMGAIARKARKAGGGTWKRPLDAEARARVCASLAEQHWRRALTTAAAGPGDTTAVRIRTWAPAPGRDFNDELRARTSAGQVTAQGRAA